MSMIETTPQLNPTEMTVQSTQRLEHRTTTIDKTFGLGLSSVYNKQDMKNVPNLNFSSIAAMEKFVTKIEWPINTNSEYFTLEFTMSEMVDSLSTDYVKDFTFLTFDNITYLIKSSLNSYVQGISLCVYDPTPYSNFYKDFYDVTLDSSLAVLMDHFKFSPNRVDTFQVQVPWNYPFRYYKENRELTPNPVTNYLHNYNLGRLRFIPLTPLTTSQKSIVKLQYTLRGKINNLQVLGTEYV
jgi:hypothetical protein